MYIIFVTLHRRNGERNGRLLGVCNRSNGQYGEG